MSRYQTTDLATYVLNYQRVPSYALFGTSIASAGLWLSQNQSMSSDQALSVLSQLEHDSSISVGTKLYVEDVQYRAGKL